MILSNFSPTTIRAGTDETITITGTGFGTQKGEVLFTRGGIDLTSPTYLNEWEYLKGLDEEYITVNGWSNTQIPLFSGSVF